MTNEAGLEFDLCEKIVPEKICVQFAHTEYGVNIRKWSSEYFDEGKQYVQSDLTHGSFYARDKPTGKFVALYADGSGGALFQRVDGPNGTDAYIDHDGDEVPVYDCFIDAGFSIWVRIHDEYKLWYEFGDTE